MGNWGWTSDPQIYGGSLSDGIAFTPRQRSALIHWDRQLADRGYRMVIERHHPNHDEVAEIQNQASEKVQVTIIRSPSGHLITMDRDGSNRMEFDQLPAAIVWAEQFLASL